MRLSLHQLHVFETIAKTESITQTAKALHMTQPAVSNILRQLETYFSCALTENMGRKIYITPSGKLLANSCKEIRLTLEQIKIQIESLRTGLAGTMSVATVSSAKYFVPRLLGAFKSAYTNIHIELKVQNRSQIIERLQNNLDDFVILSEPPEAMPVDMVEFYEDELVVVAAHNHPFINDTLTLQKLATQPWFIREEGSGTRRAMFDIMKKHKVVPTIAMEINSTESIKQAIISNMGISILSRQSIELETHTGLLRVLSVQEFPIKHKWYMVKHKDKCLSSIAKKFYEFVQMHPDLLGFFNLLVSQFETYEY